MTAAKRFGEASAGKLNASIRERLRSKVKGIQAKAAEKEGPSERKLRGLRDLAIPNRFDETKKVAYSYLLSIIYFYLEN